MAKQTGLIKLRGTLDNVSFYKTQDGILARMKTSVDSNRIATDPAYIRTRENGAEFGRSAKAGKVVRDTLRPLLMLASDNRVTARMTKVMTSIKNYDLMSSRGARNVASGINDQAAKELLKGFNFNERSNLGSVLSKSFSVTQATGEITISEVIPLNDISFPPGATHVTLQSGWAKIDFTIGAGDLQLSPATSLPIDETLQDISLIPTSAPIGSGIDIHVLCIAFYQEVNGVQYPLKNGAFNALSIVEIQ
ncbi:hypothetical protein [Fluviicola sp.]|uniref:hypothetical protein n=1 Tax=Fluviicola sp. TaxID=1917219 RepID=UPI002611C172|nr:hypothetical protein [Fluviicola sp.]